MLTFKLKELFKTFTLWQTKSNPVLLGRWSRVKDNEVFYRVDLANNDHCGSCHYEDFKRSRIRIPKTK